MTERSTQILKEALSLSSDERARLADGLLTSLDVPNPEIDAMWVREADDRMAAYDRGEMKAIPAQEVFDKIRKQKN